ncbi:toprim domain-containing protein [Candidatus Woesearchaeota archaeon]|nr:toprim domain-containing protein [Candidatus Woesearchaeota archaeon]MBW3016570.1 toprim domain-containing protein [Candidatus Woesearchaeota archaeon]
MDEESEQIRLLLDDIKKRDLLVIVEGIKDVRALNALGITNVMSLKKPLFAVVEEVASKAKEVVILTDLDEEGKKLYHELFVHLQKHGVKVDNRLREFLFKTELRQVEGLLSYLA